MSEQNLETLPPKTDSPIPYKAKTHGDRSAPEEYRLQGHWLLAKLGKRVLRPGGIEMTRHIIQAACPTSADRIVEFGPGVGKTAEILLAANPKTYIGVDPNPEGAPALAKVMAPYPQATKVVANAMETGLPDESADLVVGEAMLTMHDDEGKAKIAREAARILAPGGRYAIHEMGLTPEDIDEQVVKEVQRGLSRAVKVGARPMTMTEWKELLESAGLQVTYTWTNPMHLLEPKRIFADEGFFGALRFIFNVLRNKPARQRLMGMRQTFKKYAQNINSVGLVAVKPKK